MKLQTMLPQWQTPDQLPVVFRLGGETIHGIPAHWEPAVTVRNIDCNMTETTVTGCFGGLELRVEMRRYHDFDACEYAAYFTNHGTADSPLVEDIRMTALFPGTEASLYHGNGDTLLPDSYEWRTDPVTEAPLTVEPCGDGTSCNGAFPYMRLLFADRGVNMAFGWTGTWTADFVQTENGVALSMGQKRCRMVIRPGETIRVPSLVLLGYEGDEDTSRNVWRRWYFAHILPKQNGRLLEPKCCMHLFGAGGKPEFTGATEENQLTAIDAYLANGIHPDVWWIDAGWYPCDFQWKKTGSWYPNPDHFPCGLRPIGDRCRETGMEFLLWFEPERVRLTTDFAVEHPDWLLCPPADADQADLLVDLGNKDCCDTVIALLDSCIKESGVSIYRQDFNIETDRRSAGSIWAEAEAADRIGAMENLHIQGYYRLWDALLARNPGLLIDSCASGGRRNDIETMRRSIPLHYTDVGYGNHPLKLKQHRQMLEWIPYFRAHNMNWCAEDGSYDGVDRLPDRFSYYAAMAPALTDMTAFDADGEGYALARRMQPIWREAAARMIGTDYYPLTPCRGSSDDFYAAQFYDPAAGKGLLHLLNGSTAAGTRFTLQLKGLRPDLVYTLTSAEQERSWEAAGAELMAGVEVTMPKRTGDLWFFERK